MYFYAYDTVISSTTVANLPGDVDWFVVYIAIIKISVWHGRAFRNAGPLYEGNPVVNFG